MVNKLNKRLKLERKDEEEVVVGEKEVEVVVWEKEEEVGEEEEEDARDALGDALDRFEALGEALERGGLQAGP